jgi:hypothetical protein
MWREFAWRPTCRQDRVHFCGMAPTEPVARLVIGNASGSRLAHLGDLGESFGSTIQAGGPRLVLWTVPHLLGGGLTMRGSRSSRGQSLG